MSTQGERGYSVGERGMSVPRRGRVTTRIHQLSHLLLPTIGLIACGVASVLILVSNATHADDAPTFDADHWQSQLEMLNTAIADQSKDVRLYSRRGDAQFFLGHFDEAVADYDRMVVLDAAQDASHWRRGIALFYAGEFEKAARQFERYHSFDNVDRENGIWRFLCQVKADGLEKAKAGLLKYEKDDREPFGDVYRLFAGTITPDEIVRHIDEADINERERKKRAFYAHLYIGLWHAVHDRPDEAKPHLKRARDNPWGPAGGYGPNYMWHVGRLHYDRLNHEPAPN